MTTKPAFNVELAQRIHDQITQHPDQHDQGTWCSLPGVDATDAVGADNMCGTTACVAGWAMLFSGYKFRRGVSISYGVPVLATQVLAPTGPNMGVWVDEARVQMSTTGAELLGLNADDAYNLFCGTLAADNPEEAAADLLASLITAAQL